MKHIRYIFGLSILLALPLFSFSQVVEGVVFSQDKGEKKPLPGVNIYWRGTQRGVVSQEDGSFGITQDKEDHMLVFSFVGYTTQELHVHGTKSLEVVLAPRLELGTVEVVHKNRGTYLSTIDPLHTERINGAELHKAACCNLAESFETNPSVDVTYSDAVTGAKQIRLLGLDGIYSLLQIENMPNLRGLATNYGLTYVPGPWMESIQVSKGAASVVSGYESIAGQINAEYKKPDSQEKLFLNGFAGASGRLEFNGNGNIRVLKDKLTTGIFVHASDQSQRNDENGDGFLDEPLSQQIQLFNRWKYTNHNGFMAQAGFSLLTDDRQGGETAFRRGMDHSLLNPYGIRIENNRLEGFVKTGYVWPGQRTALAWLSNFSRHETRSFFGTHPYDGDEHRFYGSLVLTRDLDPLGRHSLNAGGSMLYDRFTEELYGQAMERTEQVPGLFAEYTWKHGSNLTLLAGVRSDFHNHFGTFVTPRTHIRYQAGKHVTLRASAGKGYRTAHVLADNYYLLANARTLSWPEEFYQEEAWNFGFALIQHYTLWNRELQLNTEFFRTDFLSQLVVDRESSANNILLVALDGTSYSNSLQLDLRYQPVERLDLLLAYRINDVKQSIGGELLEKPLTNRYKGLVSMNYTTNLKIWMFDYTVQFNGGGRIPRHPGEMTPGAVKPDSFYEFSPYTIMNAQLTRYFRHGSIYAGAENLTNFRQKIPVAGADNPFGPDFDAVNVWGPVKGRRVYLGARFNLDY